jgi:glycosyltransferase involved in cell wall biosynthesis
VSVILPVFNGADYICQCLDSLINQTYSNFEIIIIDDCSTDHTSEIIQGYADPRIRCYKNDINRGVVYSLNRAISLATGEYIARMDADDICIPSRLEKQAEYLDKTPGVGMVSAWFELFGEREGTIQYETDPRRIKCKLLFSLQLLHPGWMFRRSLVEENGLLYREEYKYAEDWDFLVRASAVTGLSNVSEVLMRYRINPKQITNVFNETQKKVADCVAKNQLLALKVELDDDTFALYRKCFGRRQIIVSTEEMKNLVFVLAKIEDANRKVGIYDPDVLHAVIQEELYHLTYFNLMHHKSSGLAFVRSSFYKGLRLNGISRIKLWLRIIRAVLFREN